MSQQTIKDKSGRTIATITTSGSVATIRDAAGRTKGTFDSKTNVTRDSAGRTVGTGNLLATLIK
jgi:YD repeat-containing protein